MKTALNLLKSKTFWFNAVTGTLMILDSLNGKIVPVETSSIIIAVGNVILRLMTTKPVSEK
jgi:hypothetical protein